MSNFPYGEQYWVEPGYLQNLADSLNRASAQVLPFAEVCETGKSYIADISEIEGIDNIPNDDPLVVIKNHPCHFDVLLLGEIFEHRPDVRTVTKASSLTAVLPESNTLLMRKNGPFAHEDDILTLVNHLRSGGSIMTVPWGSLDHQGRSYATAERAIQNALSYARFCGATVLPVCMEAEWNNTHSLPLRKVLTTIQEPIRLKAGGLDKDRISSVVSAMYERYAQ